MAKTVWAILTGEYPPRTGGVSDYTYMVAKALAAEGDEVHVWVPLREEPLAVEGVHVHRLPDAFGFRSLGQLEKDLRRLPPDFRLLVQYVPQAFGWRGMNLPLCAWLWMHRRNRPWVMFHEVMYPLRWRQPVKHNVMALITRLMASLLARASARIFVSIPAWERLLIQLAPNISARWLPVPSNVATAANCAQIASVRSRLLATPTSFLVGHFGTYGGLVGDALRAVLPELLASDANIIVVLIGRGGVEFARALGSDHPSLADRLVAAGGLADEEVSDHLAACDLLLQPFADGVSARRSSLMAGLALGVPIVTTEGPATEPIWREGAAVALAPAGQPRAQAQIAVSLLHDRQGRLQLGDRARKLYAAKFDVSHTIHALRNAATEPARESVRPASTPPKVAVAFVVNGDESSAMAERARSFGKRLNPQFHANYVYRGRFKVRAVFQMLKALFRTRPTVTYVLDIGYSGVAAGLLYRLLVRNRLIIDTGDAIYELSRSMGRGRLGQWLTWLLERSALRGADHIVVRGSHHRDLLSALAIEATFVPDGVDAEQFSDCDGRSIRENLVTGDKLVVGVLGSSVWSERLRMCYGWELVEVLRLMKDEPIRGVYIGSGSGIERLREKCREYGIEDRIHFVGKLPYDQLPEWLSVMDVCLSTQTNDIPGQVRTTGKLPLYLAAGRFVLASAVGEASKVLPDEMLVRYDGWKDEQYPRRLVERLRELLRESQRLSVSDRSRKIARENFNYDLLTRRVEKVLMNGCRQQESSSG